MTEELQRAALVTFAQVRLPHVLEEAQKLAAILAANQKPKEQETKLLKF